MCNLLEIPWQGTFLGTHGFHILLEHFLIFFFFDKLQTDTFKIILLLKKEGKHTGVFNRYF